MAQDPNLPSTEELTFVVSMAKDEQNKEIAKAIEGRFSGSKVFTANNGPEATYKIDNLPPNVLIVDVELPKLNGKKIVEWVLARQKLYFMGIVLVGLVTEEDSFIDEIIKGRVQLVGEADSNFHEELQKAISRALSFNSFIQNGNAEYQVRYLTSGEVLINEGEKSQHLYLVKRGAMLAFTNKGGKRVDLGRIGSGEFVGEMAYINNQPRSASVEATDECELIEIPATMIDHLLFQKPSWAKALMKTLSKRVVEANRKKEKGSD